jgi:hypothetical protein
MRKCSDWLIQISTSRVTFAALVVFILFMSLVLPGQSKRADNASRGADTPDLSMLYSTNDLYRMAESYGVDGRQEYVRIRFTFDLAWPLVYASFFASVTSWLFTRTFPAGSNWRLANLFPVLGMLLDFLENVSTSIIMLRYPSRTPVVDMLAPVFTFTKWTALGISLILLSIGIVVSLMKWIKDKK